MFNRYQRGIQKDWRALRNELAELTKTYHTRRAEMDTFTATAFREELDARRQEYELQIVNGAQSELAQAIAEYKSADEKLTGAQKREAARFDTVKLANEIQAFDYLFGMQSVKAKSGDQQAIKAVEKIYREAAESGDILHQRAAAEAMQNADVIFKGAPLELRAQIGVMGLQAKKDLATVRTTPEITETYAAVKSAGERCLAVKSEMLDACTPVYGTPPDTVFGGSALENAARQIAVVDGRFTVYEPDDVHVTRIKITPEAARVGGNE